MTHKITMSIFFILVGSFLSSCASGPNYSEINKGVLDSARRSGDLAIQCEQRFHDCMIDYTIKNLKATVLASELAEAAVSQCRTHLDEYVHRRQTYHFFIDGLGVRSLDHLTLIDERAHNKARVEGQELMDAGKRLSINKLIGLRQ